MKLQSFALALIAAGVANMAMAANTITFQGTVDSNTCTVNVGGSANPTVTLPTIGVGSLTATGNTAGATPFTINITGCDAGTADDVAIRFAAHNPDGTNLGSTGTATNVAVQLLDGSAGSSPITFTTGIAQTSGKTTSNGTASYDLTAQYYADAAATAGTVLAVTDYEVIYP
ncbi:fimbrial protein [Acinetobacter puyangensis]|uniref:Major type 1 subunit fimbrin (Pilin) n=1 Tax=Acinetobacter puyangensis TaxID=1096779 RepID=A0A240E6U4_9GAMM|nr:fimbrial protein [Acinetobacter puyangensis]SNX44296.1 major type 1 subunit fimbrin (pilin) [Acinetobacter puyangensis]